MKPEKRKQLLDELTFQTSRSSGKGGQNVNKTETKVELSFDVGASQALSENEKELIYKKLKNRINSEGSLRICSSQHRSQGMNKEHVVKKFLERINHALAVEKKRIATSVPAQVKETIRKQKKIKSEIKSGRQMKTRDFL